MITSCPCSNISPHNRLSFCFYASCDYILQLVTRPEFSQLRTQTCRRHASPFFWFIHVMWVSEMTVGMRPSFTSYWAYTNKPQIITFYGVRGISPADVCSTQSSPLADFCLSDSVHYNTLLSNTRQVLYNAIHACTRTYIGLYRDIHTFLHTCMNSYKKASPHYIIYHRQWENDIHSFIPNIYIAPL